MAMIFTYIGIAVTVYGFVFKLLPWLERGCR